MRVPASTDPATIATVRTRVKSLHWLAQRRVASATTQPPGNEEIIEHLHRRRLGPFRESIWRRFV
jgi:hypothetical protein